MISDNQKQMLLEQLKKTPIVQVACEKCSISRATYYRWRKDDEEFKGASDEAITEGLLFINDLSESQLVGAIKERNMTAIMFWLRHHHPRYAQKIELDGKVRVENVPLSEEQQRLIQRALKFAGITESHPYVIDQTRRINSESGTAANGVQSWLDGADHRGSESAARNSLA